MEFILFGKMISCGKNAGLFQKVTQCYVIIAVDFELRCLIGLPFLQKLTELKILKWKPCCMEYMELGNVTFRTVVTIATELLRV